MASNANNEEYDFVETPSDKYYCPVTFELLTDPRQTSECCGNRLSGAAAEQLEAEGKPCPLCKKAPLKTTMDLCFKREVMELKVYCSKKSADCEWKGELGELECHLKLKSVEGKCRFVDVQCPLECGKRIQRRHLQDHQSDKCEKRPFIIVNIVSTKRLTKRLFIIIGQNASAIQRFAPTSAPMK